MLIATNVTQQFKCPKCQTTLKASAIFRTCVYIGCFGVPTGVAYYAGLSPIASVILWVTLVLVCSIIYVQAAIRVCPPRLKVSREKNENLQTLDLGK